MTDRDELDQSFDPRTWTQAADEEGVASPKRARVAPARAERPPFFRAGAVAVAILSLGAAAAFMARPDTPTGTEMAAALDETGGELDDGDAGASVAGDQP